VDPLPEVEGFELHHGRSQRLEGGDCAPLLVDGALGWWAASGSRGGLVAGTYLHGIFENGPWRRRWLNQLRQRRNLPPLPEDQPHHGRQREALLDRLADAFEAHIDLAPLLAGNDPP
jgi:adenosylcobyric acid synthase